MIDIEKEKIQEAYDLNNESRQLVVKSTEMIQKSRYELSVKEQKILAYVISKIKPEDTYLSEYVFDIRRFCEVCGVESNGYQYETLKALLKGLKSKVWWIDLPDGSESAVSWVRVARTNKRTGKATIKLDEDLFPYLLELKKWTQYELQNILHMDSQYSIRLYELLKSYQYLGNKCYEIDELKRRLNVHEVKTYNNWTDFKRTVLDRAVNEINQKTDILINYEITKTGRGGKVLRLRFDIQTKLSMKSILMVM